MTPSLCPFNQNTSLGGLFVVFHYMLLWTVETVKLYLVFLVDTG